MTGSSFGPAHWAHTARRGSFGGQDFLPQPDGTLHCRQGATLYPQQRRPEHDGTVRVLYAARIAECRSCPLRMPCQGHGTSTKKPRRVSAVLHPLPKMLPEELPPSRLSAPHPDAASLAERGYDGNGGSGVRSTASLTTFAFLACSACALASLVATTARTQRTAPPVKMTVYGLSSQFAQALGLRVAVPLIA